MRATSSIIYIKFTKSEHHLDYDFICIVFLNFHPNRFCFISEPHELVWRSVYSILHSFCLEHLLYIFQKFQNVEPYFQIFQIPDPRKSVFWPGDVFAGFQVQKIIDVLTIWTIFCKFSDAPQQIFL